MIPRTLQRPGGRVLGWTEMGDPTGLPVLAFHGTPACRLLFEPAHEPARRHGLRLIAPDRPGYGLSEPMEGRSFADWADDAAALMDRLGVEDAPILAISGGSPYAVTTAAHLGRRITGLALVSPLGEVAAVETAAMLSRLERALFLSLPHHPRLLRRSLLVARAGILAAPEVSLAIFVALLSPADRRALAVPSARRLVIAMTEEALRAGIAGFESDLALFSQPWGVDLARIAAPAVIWQGTADAVVPAEPAFALGRRLPNAHVVRLEGQGHFWVIEHVEEAVGALAGLVAGKGGR